MVAYTIHELPHCIGYVDGTEIKLAEKPLDDPESYFSRKHIYSLKVQGICDYRLRVRNLVLGYPGSVHDATIFNNCELSLIPKKIFTGAEWLVGDSAYKLTGTVVTPFRTNATERSIKERTDFNKTLSRYRIRIEHCFGIIKERFNSLKELKIQIKNKSSIKRACNWVLVCAILHNILLDQNEEEIDLTLSTGNPCEIEMENYNEEPANHSTIEGEVK
ncbi:protein ANTAGONIST OF LIKE HETEROCHROMATIN PROTEIN 1-like [Lucilia sericata]|uniref:protein ANTAGONIST OF LIKE HETEROCHROMATIN PROTEIN 1-like n=1 Tax=Lucilia sericata TaxID=13632 RepID=UPI0018A868DC|nr:protein ANTAGONIST OF LIKE HETEROCHROMATIN PROTEIN 1-like [Lucilia sericata]